MTNITYSEALTQAKALREQKAALAKEHLSKAAKEVFESNPTLVAFKWTQYTPYFNDGEECVFRRHDDLSFKFDGMAEFQDEYEIEGENEKLAEKIQAQVSAAFGVVEKEDFKEVFGDHCEVTADRGGFHVDQYEHD